MMPPSYTGISQRLSAFLICVSKSDSTVTSLRFAFGNFVGIAAGELSALATLSAFVNDIGIGCTVVSVVVFAEIPRDVILLVVDSGDDCSQRLLLLPELVECSDRRLPDRE